MLYVVAERRAGPLSAYNSGMAFPKSSRLRATRDIERVFRRSERREGNFFIVRIHRKDSLPGRATVVVPKKVSKKAVVRNRLKRRALEWLRTEAKIGLYPLDSVVSLKPASADATKKSFRDELQRIFSDFEIKA